MSQTTLPEFGTATQCVASGSHSPVPLRFVWHHIQPKEAGGATVATNLIQVCDSCHYSIHRLLWHLARGMPLGPVPRHTQLIYAQSGYAACLSAGTVDKIPNEG